MTMPERQKSNTPLWGHQRLATFPLNNQQHQLYGRRGAPYANAYRHASAHFCSGNVSLPEQARQAELLWAFAWRPAKVKSRRGKAAYEGANETLLFCLLLDWVLYMIGLCHMRETLSICCEAESAPAQEVSLLVCRCRRMAQVAWGESRRRADAARRTHAARRTPAALALQVLPAADVAGRGQHVGVRAGGPQSHMVLLNLPGGIQEHRAGPAIIHITCQHPCSPSMQWHQSHMVFLSIGGGIQEHCANPVVTHTEHSLSALFPQRKPASQ